MADAKLTALTAASALAAADLFYVSQSAASRKATGTQLLALVGTAYVPLAGGTMTGALTIASGTLTASAPALSITQTWNNAAVTFSVVDVDVTDLASDFSSILQSWKVNGATKAAVYRYGRVYGTEFLISTAAVLGPHTLTINGSSTECVAYSYTSVGDRGVALRHVAFCNPADGALWSDLIGDSANALALRNSTTQQTFRLYNTYTDSSNFERLTLTGVAGTSVNITAETLGTGGDNLDIVLTPAGTGSVKFPSGASVDSSGVVTGAAFVTGSAGYFGGVVIGHPSSDAAFLRGSAGQIDVTNGTANTYRDLKLRNLLAGGGNGSYVQTPSMTVANLAAAATAGAGARAFVTDANATTFLSTVAAGGANKVPVVSDGTNWLIG